MNWPTVNELDRTYTITAPHPTPSNKATLFAKKMWPQLERWPLVKGKKKYLHLYQYIIHIVAKIVKVTSLENVLQ